MITLKHKKEAERLRLALMSGCENAETVTAWADSIIQEQAEPDYCFIEISLTCPNNIKEFISLLRNVGQETDHIDALRALLGRSSVLANKGLLNLRDFARWLFYTEFSWWDLPEDLFFAGIVDEQYSLVEDGVWGGVDVEAVDKEFKKSLKQFESEQSAAPNWYSAALHTSR